MIHQFLAAAALVLSLPAAAGLSMPAREAPASDALEAAWRAPGLVPVEVAHLPAPVAKAAVAPVEDAGRLRVGPVRDVEPIAQSLQWHPVRGGFVAKLRVASEGAQGLRVKLALGALPGAIELRARGTTGPIETQVVDPVQGPEAWSPWTDGAVQDIELFSLVRPSEDAIAVTALLHFDLSPTAKVAGTCTVPTMCTTGDPVLDSAVAQRKKSVMRLSFVEGGSGFVCTGTLINTERFPAAFILTANHCIHTPAVAATLTTLWFYENPICEGNTPPAAQVQVSGGASLVFTNHNPDSTLLLLNATPPVNAVYASWNAARLAAGAPIVSISHPAGDTSRLAIGSISRELRVVGVPQDMYGVRFSRGIIQGGSSGSGLFTLTGDNLELRGVLSGTTVRQPGGMSCTNLDEEGLYTRFEIFMPQILPWIGASPKASDDAPNRVQDFADGVIDTPLEQSPEGLSFARRIDYPGDVDLFRFRIFTPSWVSLWTEDQSPVPAGPVMGDSIGSILDSTGTEIESDDDVQAGDNHFGITRRLDPGTYYALVSHFDANGTGSYRMRLQAAAVDANYTDLWWNPLEPGWGVNLNHQGNILFGTLFTYDRAGAPLWLVMSNGARQADGSYSGKLYRTTGPAFNAVPFSGVTPTEVGTMTVSFTNASTGTLSYTLDGTRVVKPITRQAFRSPPTCTWSGFDRSYATNFQDLWWNPDESGWGMNIAHQGTVLFATIFTYGPDGQPTWFVMSEGNPALGGGFRGTLYRTRGPAFDASPWVPATPTAVGTLSVSFTNGNAGTLTYTVDGTTVVKSIQRQVFAMPKTECTS